jgi:hypothetical protein
MLPKECDGRVTSGPTRRVCTQKGILEARRRSFVGGALAARLGGGIANAAASLGAFDVKAFGAEGDGKTIDSPAIHKAIEAAVAAGGGPLVLLPAIISAFPSASRATSGSSCDTRRLDAEETRSLDIVRINDDLDFPWFTVEEHSIPAFDRLPGLVEEKAS